MAKLQLGDKEIDARISIGACRNAKAHHDFDLGSTGEDSPVRRINFCPVTLVDGIFALYYEKLIKVGIETIEDLEEAIEKSGNLAEIREVVLKAAEGFFPLAEMQSTKLRELLNGSSSPSTRELEEISKREASGFSS